ncbi:lysophospholipase, partial [Myxococcota bacterium]|nr:lysophospholipase [Myxococcota bacterium]
MLTLILGSDHSPFGVHRMKDTTRNIIFVSIVLLVLQSCSAYYPSKQRLGTPAGMGLAFEDITLNTADKEKLHAWFVPRRKERGVVLFSHGNGGNISYRLWSIETFHSLGYAVFIYDYRGYGRSTGTPSEKGTYHDIQAAWDYLTKEKGFAPGRIVLFGRSLGGGVTSWLAARTRPAGVILESTFTSVPDLAADLFWYLPSRYFAKQRYNTWKRI